MFALLLLLAPLQARADQAPAAAQAPAAVVGAPLDVSALLEAVRVQHDLPGMIGLTLERERVVALGATGLRKSGNDARMLATDLVHVGSCTKAMTATLCARLVQQGKLEWDTTLAQVFAESTPKMHPSWRDVTLEQLLQHRSGAPANVKPDRKGTPRQQRARQLVSVTAEPLPGERRARFEYSNVGYVLAGHMAEQVAGLDFEQLIQRELFEPLGITTAGSGAPGTPSQLSQPRGHLEMGLPIEPGPAGDNPLGMAPAGTFHMRIDDWAKFVALHLSGERLGWKSASGDDLLPAEAFVRLHTPPEGGDYALGWATAKRPWAGGMALNHNGSNTMWYCTTWLAPERGFAFLVATNQGGKQAAKGCDAAVGELMKAYLQEQARR